MRILTSKVKYSCCIDIHRRAKRSKKMLDVAVARARILEKISPCGPETVSLADATGRILVEPVVARLSNPPVSVSAMDGYAARTEDAIKGALLTVTGEAPAGHPTTQHIAPGTCIRVFTGSQIPAGTSTIILQENVIREGESVSLQTSSDEQQFIRRQGKDFQKGQTLLSAGKRLTARDIGLAAAAGYTWLSVAQRPRVGILSTGDELTLPGDPTQPDSIVNSAAFMVSGLLRTTGAEPVILPIARDNHTALASALAHTTRFDLFITIGGASVGTYDIVQDALKAHGLSLDFWKIAMRPGKPLMSGQIQGTPIIGLPGNPVAAMVCSVIFVAPAVHALMGQPVSADIESENAILGADVRQNDHRQDFLRCTLVKKPESDLPVAVPFDSQDSAQLCILSQSDALLLRAPGAPPAQAGTPCRIIRLP
ncbi:molybdopterin molybdotransferase MoeA [Acetobacter thailandicus]|uniref:molybdopterin molybdotransferase MoeA n=1 Tax=Acetobacter thailandicus TaxID=1502842 RepID=UPI001BA4462D|nr:molybdopterin molybdotransferase MoeA [Acetobacter thailandicus]